MIKPLNWYLRRHPLLYSIRFRLVSRKASIKTLENYTYNKINKIDTIPQLYFEINSLIFNQQNENLTDFEKAATIAIWLKNNIKGGPGLGNSSSIVLQKMLDGTGGVCSDFSQIYNNFCVINNLQVREWGIQNLSNDNTVSGGHSYNEVYCKEFQKWVMIDIATGVLFYYLDEKTPISSMEYIALKKANKNLFLKKISQDSTIREEHIHNIYITTKSKPFLISNYNNKTIDFFLEKLDFFPVSIIHGIITLSGKGYTFEFPEDKN